MAESESLRAVLACPPSEFFGQMIDFKRQHTAQVVRDYGPYVTLFEHSWDWMVHIVHDLNYSVAARKNWPKHRTSQFVFFPGALIALYRGFDNWLEGFYDEASILHRTTLDAIFRIIFASCYPSDVSALFSRGAPKGKRAFNVTTLMKDDLRIDWFFLWRLESSMAHAKRRATSFLASAARKESRAVTIELSYDKEQVTRPMNEGIFLSRCLMRLLLTLFPSITSDSRLDARGAIETIDRALYDFISGMPNRFSAALRNIEKIEDVIRAAEKGEDWRAVAKA